MPLVEASSMRVVDETELRGRTQLAEAYDLFRLEKQGALLSRATLDFYDLHVGALLRWISTTEPEVRRLEQVDATVLRRYRAELAERLGRHGRPLEPESLHASHRALRVFLRWAEAEGFPIDPRTLRLPAPASRPRR
jgi:hypothetical protein